MEIKSLEVAEAGLVDLELPHKGVAIAGAGESSLFERIVIRLGKLNVGLLGRIVADFVSAGGILDRVVLVVRTIHVLNVAPTVIRAIETGIAGFVRLLLGVVGDRRFDVNRVLERIAAVLADEDIAKAVVLIVTGRVSQEPKGVGHRDIDMIAFFADLESFEIKLLATLAVVTGGREMPDVVRVVKGRPVVVVVKRAFAVVEHRVVLIPVGTSRAGGEHHNQCDHDEFFHVNTSRYQ